MRWASSALLALTATAAGVLSAAPASAATCGTLAAGSSPSSCNGQYRLDMQHDGNLVLYRAAGNAYRWASGTHTSGDGVRVVMQGDGKSVLHAPANRSVWATGTAQSSATAADVGTASNTDAATGVDAATSVSTAAYPGSVTFTLGDAQAVLTVQSPGGPLPMLVALTPTDGGAMSVGPVGNTPSVPQACVALCAGVIDSISGGEIKLSHPASIPTGSSKPVPVLVAPASAGSGSVPGSGADFNFTVPGGGPNGNTPRTGTINPPPIGTGVGGGGGGASSPSSTPT